MTTSLRRPKRYRIANTENRIDILGARRRHAIRVGTKVRFAIHFTSDLETRELVGMVGRVVDTRGIAFPRLIAVDWNDGYGPTLSTEAILDVAGRDDPNRGIRIRLRPEARPKKLPPEARPKKLPPEARPKEAPRNVYDAYRDALPLMWRLWAEGLSHRSIARRLNAEGFVTRHGNRWGNTSVARVMGRNPGDIPAARTRRARPLMSKEVEHAKPLRTSTDAPFRDLIPLMWSLRAEGLIYREIAARLNAEGHVNRTGKLWNTSQVWRVLGRNPVGSPAPGGMA